MPRKPYSLLAPKPGKRRTWAVLIRTQARKRIQRSTGSPHEAAAREFALLYRPIAGTQWRQVTLAES